MIHSESPEWLLRRFALWGGTALIAFLALLFFLACAVFEERARLSLYALVLFSGFLWIGSTALSRHAFVLTKRSIGKEAGFLEFVATQFIVILLPFAYMRMRNEIRDYRQREKRGETEDAPRNQSA